MPTGKIYKLDAQGFDLVPYEEQFETLTGVNKIKFLVSLINQLNSKKITKLKSRNDGKLYQTLIQHESTKLPRNMKLEAYKNFIASHIETIIQDVRNAIGAYTPIEMEVLRDASVENSAKENTASTMTLSNPAVLYEMQYENMTGKKVIGITATGEKASFMWHYWLNDIIRDNYEDYLKYGYFEHTLKQINGRARAAIEESLINTLPDVNLEGVTTIQELRKLKGDITVDAMISQLLSAATDNAKELILAKINAGSKLAKCYLYLITLGYNIADIVNFMTSPTISFVDLLTEENVYENINLTINQAIEIAEGKIPKAVLYSFGSNAMVNKFKSVNKGWENFLINGMELINPYESDQRGYIETQDLINYLNEIRSHRPENINMEDIADFKEILKGANEFSNFGRLLGLNQGLPTSKTDLRSLLQFIQDVVKGREKDLGIVDKNGITDQTKLAEILSESDIEKYKDIIDNFDASKYLTNDNYRELAIDYQNAIKQNIPILKIIEDIPQFKSIITLLGTVVQIDKISSIKSRTFDTIMDDLKKRGYYVDEFMQKGIISYIDDLLIMDYMKQTTSLPIESGTKTFNTSWQQVFTGNKIVFSDPVSIASFKYVFENVIIPNLQDGKYYNGEEEVYDERLKYNELIQGLIRTTDKDVPLYKANIDMLAKDSSSNNIIKFQKYVNGLQKLSEIKIGNQSLSDWFIVYNLVVNKNHYGSDRLTTLLQEFLQEGKSNFLQSYLNYIGKKDYDQDFKLNYTIQDVLVATAKIVNSTAGHREPMLFLRAPEGLKLMEYSKENYDYKDSSQLIPEVSGESPQQHQQRLFNRLQYGTLHIDYSHYIEETIKDLSNLNSKSLEILGGLMRQGILIISNSCE